MVDHVEEARIRFAGREPFALLCVRAADDRQRFEVVAIETEDNPEVEPPAELVGQLDIYANAVLLAAGLPPPP